MSRERRWFESGVSGLRFDEVQWTVAHTSQQARDLLRMVEGFGSKDENERQSSLLKNQIFPHLSKPS